VRRARKVAGRGGEARVRGVVVEVKRRQPDPGSQQLSARMPWQKESCQVPSKPGMCNATTSACSCLLRHDGDEPHVPGRTRREGRHMVEKEAQMVHIQEV